MKQSTRHVIARGFFALSFAAAFTPALEARAQACGRTASSSQFDSFYAPLWGCQQARVDDMWSRFDFDEGDWDGAMGFNDPCNDARPLKRTFNALQLLAYGVTTSPTCSTSNANVGHWAYCFSGNNIDELDGSCATDARATTVVGTIIDNYTELKAPFFYDETVVQRAATIFHEARHAHGWCSHTGGCLDGSGSCDPNWNNGCVGFGSGDGPGANAYSVRFLSWFATTARASWINATIRANAVAEGNYFLARRFETDPCFRLDSSGFSFKTC
jgi:hypothetical protein